MALKWENLYHASTSNGVLAVCVVGGGVSHLDRVVQTVTVEQHRYQVQLND